MLATLLTTAIVCIASLTLGQGVLRLCGWRVWSWQSAPVGFAVLMLLCVPSVHAPGGPTTVAVVIGALALASIAAMARDPALRPSLSALAAALPVALLAVVPYLSADRWGTLAVSFNNDMSVHLLEAEAYASSAVFDVNGISDAYPLGPHAVVGVFSGALGLPVDYAFGGLMVALTMLLAWSALAQLRRAGWLARGVVATLVAMTFLVAAFYVEASFKEIVLALLLLGFASSLSPRDRPAGALRWIPGGLLIGGMLSVYSYTGLVWPVAAVAVWVAGLLLAAVRDGERRRSFAAAARAELVPVTFGVAAVAIAVVPQSKRLLAFYEGTSDGLDTAALGNLVGRLPFWEAFGIWGNPDFRMSPADQMTTGVWAAGVLALAIFGLVWWIRRGEWALPATAIGAFLVWVASNETQSPYIASKALMVLAPFIALLAIRPLVERTSWPANAPRWMPVAATFVALVLVVKVLGSSWSALRTGFVGPRDHMLELRSLRSVLGTDRTLFLGNDDFIRWELAGVPVEGAVIVVPRLPMRAQKPWDYGQPVDVDLIDAQLLNEYRWIVMPRDAAASQLPEQFRRVRSTRNYAVWERTGEVAAREVLAERDGAPGARLDCSTPAGRSLSRSRGSAAIRREPVVVPAPGVAAGATADVELRLDAGLWDLQAPYTSPVSVEVTGPGLHTTLVPNLDRPGNRWPIGRVRLARAGAVRLRLRADDHTLTPGGTVAAINAVVATPVGSERLVPLREACGRYVDWYRLLP